MNTRNRYGSPYHPYYWEHDVLVDFDLSSISPDAVVLSATLYLYYYEYGDNNPAGRSLTLYRVTSDWAEGTVTWNTRPSIAPVPTSASIVPSYYTWMEWDVTSDVQLFVAHQVDNFGWQIMDEEKWGWFDIPITKFHTKEYGDYLPYLEVELGSPSCAFSNFPGWLPRKGTLNFGMTWTNPLEEPVTVEGRFEVWMADSLMKSYPYAPFVIAEQDSRTCNVVLGPACLSAPLGTYTIINRFTAGGFSCEAEEEFEIVPHGWVDGYRIRKLNKRAH
jgi:hypothetical protein